MMISNKDTICAIATPPGAGGIGVVRISGPLSHEILETLWAGHVPAEKFEARKLYLGEIKAQNGKALDQVMAVFMPEPQTYTGQDIVEFSCHGSPIVLEGILEACKKSGARLANPGEFTRRAFLSGKIDLVQAEAVAELIHSTGTRSALEAASHLSGKLSKRISSIQSGLMDIRKFIEASIDFPEEDVEFIEKAGIVSKLKALFSEIETLINSYEEGRLISEGVHVAIVGRPNVGKSSILNLFAGENRAIVHHRAGTTRDLIECSIDIGGLGFKMVDTAGLRTSDCEVEGEGIRRSQGVLKKADIVLYIIDGSQNLDPEDLENLKGMKKERIFTIFNKSDLEIKAELNEISKYCNSIIEMSAKTGSGLDILKKGLLSRAMKSSATTEGLKITSLRQKESLEGCLSDIKEALNSAKKQLPTELIAENLRSAHDYLSEITGENVSESVLDQIFSSFCIGK